MTLVYCPTLSGNVALPDADESHHLAHVLRKRSGDQVTVTDGCGRAWQGEITTVTKKEVRIQLLQLLDTPPDSYPHIHIGIAPPKQAARLEWFLEKSTEAGVGRITLLSTERCERSRWRHDRLERILIAAMKQSGRWHLPVLDKDDATLPAFLERYHASDISKLIATCDWGNLRPLSAVYTPGSDSVVLIGPEGDFTPAEVLAAKESGFAPVLLGPHRLRTETAGVVACAQIMVLNEKN